MKPQDQIPVFLKPDTGNIDYRQLKYLAGAITVPIRKPTAEERKRLKQSNGHSSSAF